MPAGNRGTLISVKTSPSSRTSRRADGELRKGYRSAPRSRLSRDCGVIKQEQGSGIGVGFGEAEVAPNGAHVAHSHVGHTSLGLRD